MQRDTTLEKSIAEKASFLETAESATERTEYPVDKVLWAGKTEFVSELLLVENKTQGKMLITDGELQSSTSDEKIYHEHLIHPTVLFYKSLFSNGEPLRVLVLGAGEGATVRELLKYSSVGYVLWNDIDKDLVDLCEEHLGYNEGKYNDEVYAVNQERTSRVKRIYEDANTLLPKLIEQGEKFDIVINDLPDPGEGIRELTGLYSVKFFDDMYQVLKESGVIVTHAGPTSFQDFEVISFLRDGLQKAGMCSASLLGLVPIPSFQSEWGYIYFAKGSDNDLEGKIKYNSDSWKVEATLPPDCDIVDVTALDRFFAVPNYYFPKE
jgi:spermidine synthase